MEERNPILEITELTGLDVTGTGVWHNIPYGWADNWHRDPEYVFAKYLFTFTTAEQWNQMYRVWDSFVTEVIEPVYFQLANDISWNLYWVSVLEEEQLNQLDPQQRLSFCSNTEYTRNIVIPLERISQFVPVGHIHLPPSCEGMQAPSEIWDQQLEANGLGFCLKGFSQASLERYINGEMVKDPLAEESVAASTNSKPLNMLHSIFIPQNFRAHYFQKAWNIPFQQVNLLYGANGTGKTSLFSGIEMAITGEVRSLSGTEDAPVLVDIALEAEEDGQSVTLNPPCTDADKKQRERRWYQGRSNNRTGPQLKNLFHRFNYLSVEETFLFISQQPDLADIFSKILYGVETSDMWANQNRYQSKCSRVIEELEQKLEQELRLFQRCSEVPLANQTELSAYLSASGLNLSPDRTPADILAQVQRVQAEYDKVRDLAPILSRDQIRQKRLEQETNRNTLKKKWDELQEQYRQAAKQAEEWSHAEEACVAECQKTDERYKALQTLEPLVLLFQFRTRYQREIDAYQSDCGQLKFWNSQENRLRMLITNHKETLEYPPEKSIRQIVQEMAEVQKKYFDLKGRFGGIHTQIDKAEDAQERQTKLFSSLRVAGLELYQMQNGRHECPLCGTDGITQSKLLAHLEAESTQADQQLQALYLQRDDLEREIATAASELKRLDQQQATALKYRDALSQLQQEFPDLNNFSDLSQQHEFAMEQQESFQVKTTQAKKALMEKLREIGSDYTIEDVLNCKHRLFDLTLSANLVLPLKESNESILEHFAQIKEDGRIQKEKNAEVLRQTRELRNRQVQAAQSCRTELEQIRNWLGQIEIELTQLVRLETFWERIHDVTDNADLTGEAVQSVCEHICKLARSVIDYTQYIESKESYLCSKEMLEQKLRRCYVLKKELESLKPPDFYADQFIRQNIAQISQIFLTLHSPQEFSRLDITEDNKLAAFRNKVAVPVSQMSTGQRTALVVATFFQMTLATPFAPNFLLLDEPVANIDDLNVLALMDFLRELTITHGKQIFFTTANRNVAKLFRRKFSFLRENFQELCFLRENEHCLQISSRRYDQNRLLSDQTL